MGLESATYISDLVASNPTSSDLRAQGDDHLRLIKAALQATFPNANRAIYFETATSKSANFSVVASDENNIFYIDTSGGAVTATLPATAGLASGWSCKFVKTNTGTNPYFVAPASGTIISGDQSGLAKTRRSIPGHPVEAVWTGSAWYVTRAVNVPIGAVVPCWRSSVPVGYESPDGSTLASASTNYPDFYQANGSSGVLPDCTGRAIFGKEAAATRLTAAGSGIDGATKGATGGAQTVTLAQANLPNVNFTVSVNSHSHDQGTLAGGSHSHGAGTYALPSTGITNGSGNFANNATTRSDVPSGGGNTVVTGLILNSLNLSLPTNSISGTSGSTSVSISGNTGSTAPSGTAASGGTGTAVNKMPPTIVFPFAIVVE